MIIFNCTQTKIMFIKNINYKNVSKIKAYIPTMVVDMAMGRKCGITNRTANGKNYSTGKLI